MKQREWREVKSLFQAVIDLPESQRETFINESTGDTAVRNELLRMVEIHCESSDFLESPLNDSPHQRFDTEQPAVCDHLTDQTFDGFTIEQRIGSGGMGSVYRARQSHPDRLVAIKVLHVNGRHSQSLKKRFETEAKFLARLHHPNIAHIYSAGVHDFGNGDQPWFAMELVDGVPINEFLQDHRFSDRQKLELLVMVCEAVQHAHDRGVIHRDLKPANILITKCATSGLAGGFEPKIVDFGVARETDVQMHLTMQTAAGDIIGTLNYMSPEQVSTESTGVTQQSDVFALAVIGFEVLTGVLPFDRRRGTLLDSLRNIENVEPSRLAKTDSKFRGDLDIIFAKGLEHDLSRRYQSAQDLANDLASYLNNEPILARQTSKIYQCRKFLSRHRALVTGTLATIVALTIGLVLYANEAHRARAAAAESRYEAAKATAINNFITNDFIMKFIAAANSGNDRQSNIDLVNQAATNISSMFGDRPAIEAAVRNEVGTIYYNLGAMQEAREQFADALQLWESQLDDDHPDTLKAVNNLGLVFLQLGNDGLAETLFRRALQGRIERLGESDTHSLGTMNNLAEVLRKRDKFVEAEAWFRRAIKAHRDSGNPADRASLTAMANLGSLLIKRGELSEALELHRRAFEKSVETFGEDNLMSLYARSRFAQTLYRAEDYQSAEEMLLPLLKRFSDMRGDHHFDTIVARRLLAMIFVKQTRLGEAEQQLRLAESALVAHNIDNSQLKKVRRQLDELDRLVNTNRERSQQ